MSNAAIVTPKKRKDSIASREIFEWQDDKLQIFGLFSSLISKIFKRILIEFCEFFNAILRENKRFSKVPKKEEIFKFQRKKNRKKIIKKLFFLFAKNIGNRRPKYLIEEFIIASLAADRAFLRRSLSKWKKLESNWLICV